MTVNSDKDNNSAVISLGEIYSDNTVQHLSSTGSPPPMNGASVDEAPPHRASVNRCGSPPTGRSVSFMCEHVHRNETDGNGSARTSGRRQSGEQRETSVAVPTVPTAPSVAGSASTQYHVEDDKCTKVESVRTDVMPATTCPSGVRVCKCVTSVASRLSDVEGCPPVSSSGHSSHENRPTPDVEVDEMGRSHISTKQTSTPECCVIHVSSSS